ncbi:hypothetical protein GHT06_016714 [Daphnia sinensis]|uniref:Uncharacterized protein n=1 Tax=Daphnia sinensis TaxID=1820382 RepID=A0AAD5PVE0_9CRUS|nr:hypothetical protein GHT06_016714 [Daphnia sinensis]
MAAYIARNSPKARVDITLESHDPLETAGKKLRRLLRCHYDDIILPCQSFECNPRFFFFPLLLSSIAFYNPSLLLCCLRRHILLYRIWAALVTDSQFASLSHLPLTHELDQ